MLFDPIYWAIIIVGGLISLAASMYTKASFRRAQEIPLQSGKTGYEVATQILREKDIMDVEVVEHQGFLSDHYNPMTKTLALSPEVYHGRTAAAAGVAAHEVGHALQHAHNYAPMWMRSLIVPVANIGSMLGPWLIIAGIFMGSAGQIAAGHYGFAYYLAIGGVALFGAATAFTLVTLPVEFDASARAKAILPALNITRTQEEDDGVKKVLTAAGLTYVAAALVSIMQLLYWAAQAGLLGGNRDD